MPRRKSGGDPDKVYISEPAPKKQKRFPSRRQTIDRSNVADVAPPRLRSQKSLTQMHYVASFPPNIPDEERQGIREIEINGEDDMVQEDEDVLVQRSRKRKRARVVEEIEDDGDEESEVKPVRKKRSIRNRRKFKDSEVQESEDEIKEEAPRERKLSKAEKNKLRQKTLTQMIVNGRKFAKPITEDIPDPEEVDHGRMLKRTTTIGDSTEEDEDLASDLENSDSERPVQRDESQELGETLPVTRPEEIVRKKDDAAQLPKFPTAPQTPKRFRVLEIPSSQSPAVTPLTIRTIRTRSQVERSPLQERSINTLDIADSPTKAKSVRFVAEKAVSVASPKPKISSQQSPRKSPQKRRITQKVIKDSYSDSEDEDHELNTQYDPGVETQARLLRTISSSSLSSVQDIDTPEGLSTEVPEQRSAPNTGPSLRLNLTQGSNQQQPAAEENPLLPSYLAQESFEKLPSLNRSASLRTNSWQDSYRDDTDIPMMQFDSLPGAGSLEGAVIPPAASSDFMEHADVQNEEAPQNQASAPAGGNVSQADSASAQLLNDMWDSQRQSSSKQTSDGEDAEKVADSQPIPSSPPQLLVKSSSLMERQDMLLRPSQVSTVDITQSSPRTQRSQRRKSQKLRFSSPLVMAPTQIPSSPTKLASSPPRLPSQFNMANQPTLIPSSPVRPMTIVQVPSSPIPMPPSFSPKRRRQETQSSSSRPVPTVSQLLPDSLLWDVPAPPVWTDSIDID